MYKVESTFQPNELYKLFRANKEHIVGKFLLDKSIPSDLVLKTVFHDSTKLSMEPNATRLVAKKVGEIQGAVIVDESRWDSEHFGVKIGKAKILCFDPSTNLGARRFLVRKLANELTEKRFRLILLRVPTKDSLTTNALQREGATVVDTLVTFHRDALKQAPPRTRVGATTAEITKYDEGQIIELARNVFRMDHFHADPLLPEDRSDELYAKWAKNCFCDRAKGIVISRKGSSVLGFIICKIEHLAAHHKYGVIDLVGTDKENRGNGIGTSLVAEALRWFSKRASSVYVGTQAGNISAIRLYEKMGFKAVHSEVTLHLWLPKS